MSWLLSLMWMFSILFMFLKHPLSLGGILLIQSILISLIIGLMNFNFWFSYILFLVMVGGMMVLFIYMTSIASNEKFKTSFNMILLYLIFSIFLIFLLLLEKFMINSLFFSMDLSMFSTKIMFNFSMTKYFNFPSIMIMMIIMIYLLITLIATVKITSINYGPLRQKF
uniref:NADH-ubiquinone oxidoreductase chain 6 n=1 Tax=Rhizophagus aeneus TaxID=1586534 RepID=A0A343C3M8_9CUCU|nr:NADH dehydrogenase subunit 6 [Rhizophagus aeneus]